MNNIEKLAIEHQLIDSDGEQLVYETDAEYIKQLEAFSKALQSSEQCSSCNDTGDIHSADGQYAGKCPCKQSSEPVAEVRCRNGEVFGYIPSRVLRDMLPLGTKLFAHPPATVPLEKYNKLLDALKYMSDMNVGESGDSYLLRDMAREAIAEAEGKEG